MEFLLIFYICIVEMFEQESQPLFYVLFIFMVYYIGADNL